MHCTVQHIQTASRQRERKRKKNRGKKENLKHRQQKNLCRKIYTVKVDTGMGVVILLIQCRDDESRVHFFYFFFFSFYFFTGMLSFFLLFQLWMWMNVVIYIQYYFLCTYLYKTRATYCHQPFVPSQEKFSLSFTFLLCAKQTCI